VSGSDDQERQGWYRDDISSPKVRVRMAVEGRSLVIHSLGGALLARWSLEQLENRSVPVFGRDWVIGDRRLPGPSLVIENDGDYASLRAAGGALLPTRERAWRQLFFAAGEAGNLTGWPVLIPIGIGLVILAVLLFWLV
jgi:hypothetical protein